eukprot:gene9379-biopygen10725
MSGTFEAAAAARNLPEFPGSLGGHGPARLWKDRSHGQRLTSAGETALPVTPGTPGGSAPPPPPQNKGSRRGPRAPMPPRQVGRGLALLFGGVGHCWETQGIRGKLR